MGKIIELIHEANNSAIYTPNIKLDILRVVLDSNDNCKAIVVRWEFKYLFLAPNDLETFSYLILLLYAWTRYKDVLPSGNKKNLAANPRTDRDRAERDFLKEP